MIFFIPQLLASSTCNKVKVSTFPFVINGIHSDALLPVDNKIKNFKDKYGIPGISIALSKNGKLVYERSLGFADFASKEPVQPYHLFRIASVTKPVTATAIMKLVENGQLSLSDKVFGPDGILNSDPYFSNIHIMDTRIYDITVKNLLEHSAGWNRDIDCVPNPTSPYNFQFKTCDPIAFPLHVTQTLSESNPVSIKALIKFLLLKGLNFSPGTSYAYCNIGYSILGLVIEKISGQSYEDYIRSAVLDPLGIYDMHLARNLLSEKQEREVEYVEDCCKVPSIYGTGDMVLTQYGGYNVEAMAAHGGWIASAKDLLKFMLATDASPTKPDIISSAYLSLMTSPSPYYAGYGMGWEIHKAGNWFHMGSIEGTASYMGCSSTGYDWVILMNKFIYDKRGPQFWKDLEELPYDLITNTPIWPKYDLFLSPTTNASNLRVSNVTSSGAFIQWHKGDGENRIVVLKQKPKANSYPLDGLIYKEDATFKNGTDIGNNNYVIYNGSGEGVNVDGLSPKTDYSVVVFEYNQNQSSNGLPLYKLCGAAQANFRTN